jgi:hypothetical protein
MTQAVGPDAALHSWPALREARAVTLHMSADTRVTTA